MGLSNHLYPCVIPSITKDYQRMRMNYIRLFSFLPISELVFLGPADLEEHVLKDKKDGLFGDNPVRFVCETSLIDLNDVRPVFNSLINEQNNLKPTAVNWYYQQFLKMAFSLVCEEEYYLCWDADTLPLRHIDMFSSSGKPYLDVKTEMNETYFITINNLFGFSKIIAKSFISEHMLFNVSLMKEMIAEIERTSFGGTHFYEKILYAAGSENLNQGFSEFETYGSWVGMRHSSAYMLRDWQSFRNTNFFVDIKDVQPEDLDWLAKDYDAATFEKYQETNDVLNQLFRDPRYREKLTPKQFYTSILESGIFGEYTNGAVATDGFNAPA